VVSGTSIIATAPPQAAATIDVTVTSFAGTSSTSSADHFLFVNPATTLAVTSSLNPATHGTGVTFTATVSWTGPGTPSGTIIFMDGTTEIGTGTLGLSGGSDVATLLTSSLPVGNDVITALYYGDGAFDGSTGAFTETIT
jgi:hypothetical protein